MKDTFTLILSRADVDAIVYALCTCDSEVPGAYEHEMDLARKLYAILEDGAESPVIHSLASRQ